MERPLTSYELLTGPTPVGEALQQALFPRLSASDTTFHPDTAWLLQPAPSAAEVWGPSSTLAETLAPHTLHRVEAPREPWQTSVVMVVLICFYCYIMYRFRRDMMSCLKNIGNTEDTLTLMEGQGADFVYLLRSGMALAVLSGAALIMTWMELKLPGVESYYLFFGAVAAFLLIVLYRRVAFAVMRWLTDQKELFHEITFINRIDITFIALCYTPLAVIIGVSGRLFELGLVVLALLILYHFTALYKYFRLRLFSKLQWILYLCAVEILPVSFIIALAIRKSGIN
ncbi:MAG TPA: DUF4271 domain-containing protein [Candidatus Rikenella faecigallinarum]|uniref:DUF4271 domain-containing protein n=1 Tax=Candidatus Rikenella faecigallinarum TaxID=2838745 RepID=A0A9D1QEJ2_9BACT|nr:DUF4271 domain-containing protein [Candidatus Rikenella faecigallinarum]